MDFSWPSALAEPATVRFQGRWFMDGDYSAANARGGDYKLCGPDNRSEFKIRDSRSEGVRRGFALYEVLCCITIFAIGVIALGHAVENCPYASTINARKASVRQILSNRMAEIQGHERCSR